MLVRAPYTVKLTASDRICARLAAPVSLPESDTIEVTEMWRDGRRITGEVFTFSAELGKRGLAGGLPTG